MRPPSLSSPSRRLTSRRDSGFALLLVLFLVTILSAAVVQFSFTSQVTLSTASRRVTALQHELALKAGLVEALRVLRYDDARDKLKQNPYDGLDEPWAQPIEITVGTAAVTVRIQDERAALRLNSLIDDQGALIDIPDQEDPKDRLVRLLSILENPPDTHDADLLEALVDWIDKAPAGQTEIGRFETNAKNGPLYTHPELLLVPGWSREVLYGFTREDGTFAPGLISFVSTRWGDGLTNPNTAPTEVLRALSTNMTEPRVTTLLQVRSAAPFTSVQDVANALSDWPELITELGGILQVRSTHFLVEVVSTIGKTEDSPGSVRQAVAHLLRDESGGTVMSYEPRQ